MRKTLSYLKFLFTCSLAVAVVSGIFLPGIAHSQAEVWLVEMRGPIGPASSDFLTRTITRAGEANAELVVIRLDTPGGLDMAMRDIVSSILASTVPVATWVAPGGARAASAGTYIMYASHIAAMAPATNIGSSTPVQIGGGGMTPGADEPDEAGAGTDMERKVINDAVAYLRGLAELRGRNADWAELTVREAANLSASEALAENVIDLIARNLDILLTEIDGREIEVAGVQRVLSTADASIEYIEPGWRYQFLSTITNPNVAYILLMIGIYGLILEFYNPGMGLPGVTGIICLLVAAFALQMLPINFAGLALIVVGVALMVFEVFSPSFGVLGIGGLIAFTLGSVMLMDTDLPGYQISLPLIAAMTAATGIIIIVVLGAVLRARHQRVTTGKEAMIGGEAVALEAFERKGHVRAYGETWTAVSENPVNKGDRLRITKLDGLLLYVKPEP